jgi:hypothetical protein
MIRGLPRVAAMAAAALIGGTAHADEPPNQGGPPGEDGSATIYCWTSEPHRTTQARWSARPPPEGPGHLAGPSPTTDRSPPPGATHRAGRTRHPGRAARSRGGDRLVNSGVPGEPRRGLTGHGPGKREDT